MYLYSQKLSGSFNAKLFSIGKKKKTFMQSHHFEKDKSHFIIGET